MLNLKDFKNPLFMIFASFLIFLSVPNSASSDLLFNQPYDSTISGYYSNIGGQVGEDDFLLLNDSIITGITWYGYYGTDLNSSVTSLDFQLALEEGGTSFFDQSLSAQITDTLTDTSFDSNTYSIYQFSVDSLSITISALDTNWISIAENDSSTPRSGDTQWLWSRSAIPYYPTTLSFELYGTSQPVPEPATILLLSTGLIGLAGFRKKFKK